MTGLHATLAGD